MILFVQKNWFLLSAAYIYRAMKCMQHAACSYTRLKPDVYNLVPMVSVIGELLQHLKFKYYLEKLESLDLYHKYI